MTGKIVLTAMAAVGSLAVWAAAQDPSFEFPGAKHVGYEQSKQEQTAPPALSVDVQDHVYNVSFKNAPNSEVIDWLKNQGLSFAVPDDQLDKSGTISLNISNASIEKIMRAIGRAWGGRWEKDEDVYVFRKGSILTEDRGLSELRAAPVREMMPPAQLAEIHAGKAAKVSGLSEVKVEGMAAPAELFEMQAAKSSKLGKGMPTRVFGTPMPAMPPMPMMPAQGREMTEAEQKQFEKSMEKWSQEWSKTMEKWSKEHEQFFKTYEKNFDAKAFKMDEKAMQELYHSMPQIAHKNGQLWINGKEIPMDGPQVKVEHRDGKLFIDGKAIPMPKIEQRDGSMWIDGKEIKTPKIEHRGDKLFIDGKQVPGHDSFKFETKNGKTFLNGKEFKGQVFKFDDKSNKFYMDGKEMPMKGFFGPAAPGKAFTFDSKAFKEMQGKNWAPAAPGKAFTFDGKAFKELQGRGFAPMSPMNRSTNFEGLYDSLTTMQEETLKRRGYLNYSDLNSKQRNMLGTMGGGSWSVTYNNNGKSITIKSDK